MKKLGVATMQYAEDGSMLETYFKPIMKVHLSDSLAKSLGEKMVEKDLTPTDPEIVKERADLVLASFFATMTDIELADREEYEIRSEVLQCTKWPNGQVKMCKILYSFVKI